jgi:acetolactate synthase I/II/III large subunit
MRASDLLVECLEAEGVERVFGIPGEENLDVMDALKGSGVEFVLTRHENSAAFIASTCARLTNRPHVCLSTLGPGATNMVTGVAEAFLSYIPLIAITGQVGADQAFVPRKQHLDLGQLYQPVTKASFSLRSPENIPSMVRRAFQLASQERPGPVHLELPEDAMKAQVKGRPLSCTRAHQAQLDRAALGRARDIISSSKRPLILAGPGVSRSGAGPSLRKFARSWGIPVAHTWHGAGVMPYDDELSLNTVGLRAKDRARKVFEQMDAVLLVGFDVPEFQPGFWNVGVPKKVVGLVAAPLEAVPGLQVDLQLVGPLDSMLRRLSTEARRKENWALGLRQDLQACIDGCPADSSPVKPQLAVRAIRSCLGRSDICTSDVGAHLLWLAKLYPVYQENTLLLTNGLIPMGIGIPSAIGAKLVHPDRKVVSVVGDGGLMMSAGELETAKRLGTSFVTVVFNDSGLGLIKLKHEKAYKRHYGTDFGNPDLVRFAESFGAVGYRVKTAKELDDVLAQALRNDELALIDVPVDYRENDGLF